MKNRRVVRGVTIALAVLLLPFLFGCGKEGTRGHIVVGCKAFTENKILAEVYSLALEDAGYEVERVYDIQMDEIHGDMLYDKLDIYPEYIGTGLVAVLGEEPMTDPLRVYNAVSVGYENSFDIRWLEPSPANDGYGLVIRTDVAQKYGITTISDLQDHASELRFAELNDLRTRNDGFSSVESVYGAFDWASSTVYNMKDKFAVLEENLADVTTCFTLDARMIENQFTLLEEDKKVWPPYNIAPIVRGSVLDRYPDIADILNPITAEITDDELLQMNARVDLDGESYTAVAMDFYKKHS